MSSFLVNNLTFKNKYSPLNELEKLSHFLHGAHSTCYHDNSSATFHQTKHYLDEIIVQIKQNSKSFFISKDDILSGTINL